jgi:adenine-specific DNA-methyltransferase
VRSVLDEVFGSENFISLISYSKTTTTTGEFLANTTDYILWYARDADRTKYRALHVEKALGGSGATKYDQVQLANGSRRAMTGEEKRDPTALPQNARPFRLDNLTSPRIREARTGYFPIKLEGRDFVPQQGEWKTHREGIQRLIQACRVQVSANTLGYVRFLDDFPAYPLSNTWMDIGGIQSRADPKIYAVQTSTTAIERCLLMTTDPGDLVLDPTCGSGTTAYVGEQWGRRWITIDTSRVALALARTRLMAAKYPYYLLADSSDGVREALECGGLPPLSRGTGAADSTAPPQSGSKLPHSKFEDIKKGFVYKRVPHVTLKSIANNPDIKEGMTRAEIDATIARRADTELLYDQPYEDGKRVRVTGPFTVESLSPHRVLASDEERPASEAQAQQAATADQFETMIIDNLRKAGVQNTRKNERLVFDRLEPYAGEWLQAAGSTRRKTPPSAASLSRSAPSTAPLGRIR